MAEEIKITVDKDGKVTMEAFGFEGQACHTSIDALFRKLGGKKVEDKKKATFYQKKVTVGNQNRVK